MWRTNLKTIEKLIKSKIIRLENLYKREREYDEIEKSKFIELILTKKATITIYIEQVDPYRWYIVDGLQQLIAINDFLIKKSLTLKEVRRNLNEKTVRQLNETQVKNLLNTKIIIKKIYYLE